MIAILSFLISLTTCETFIERMQTTNNVIDAKLQIAMAKKHLTPKELDDGVMMVLKRIHNKNWPNHLPTTEKEKNDMTKFLFRIARDQ